MNNSVIVLVEHLRGNIVDITYEMLGVGKKIAQHLNVPLLALVIGKDVSKLTPNLGLADSVLLLDDEKLEITPPQLTAKLVENVYKQKQASILLLACTNITAGVGPILARRLDLPFINFCKTFRFENGDLFLTSQLYGGKILSEVKLIDNKGIVGIYPGSFPLDAGKSDRTAPVEELEVPDFVPEPSFKKYIEPELGDIDITKENILVSVGRGIQNKDNIEIAEELAEAIGGAVSASRPVVDQGWLPLTRQVGKSGMIVKPKLYLALGISGAPEHQEGMKNSETILAINTDPKAPIFNIAHYGVVGDLFEIVPILTEKLKQRKG
ncbi:MAG: electron transfer flavoprotein subunit alpha/FixB family protein [Ignavibacteria bacterium]|nr:electron transfer flavoprotein subunit alpha/FixB family protein [Ignavibacteria bacterium]